MTSTRRLRLCSLLLMLLALLPFAGCDRATTPTEVAAITAADHDHVAYTLPAEKLARAEHLYHDHVALHFTGELWSVLQLWLILQLGIAARMRNVAVNLTKKRWVQGAIFLLELLVLTTLLNLPVSLAAHHVQRVYGLSVQSWGSWWVDAVISLVITYVVGGLLVLLLMWFIRKFPRTWWFWFWFPLAAAVLLGVFLTPYVVDPLFNKFQPLEQTNPALVAQLERVVQRGHGIQIPPSRMFLMKASSKVTTLNAYVTGFGSSKRVVVWDTSIAKGTPDEIAFIFGHEMGHYVLGHVVSGVAISLAGLLVGLFLVFHGTRRLLARYGRRWRIPAQENWAAVVVILLVASVLSMLAEPIGSTISRSHEHAADVFGEEVVHGIVADPQTTGEKTFQLLGEDSLSTPYPSPFVEFWTGSHPPTWFRAAFAEHYNPWTPGAAPKYFAR